MAQNMDILTDEHKDLLNKRYKKLEWCDDTKELQCVHCKRVAIHHYISNCKHLYCLNCRNVINPENHLVPWKCNECSTPITQLDHQSEKIENKIYQLKVCCPNKMYGCTRVDTLKNIAYHLKDCKDTREKASPDITMVISAIKSARDSLHNELEKIKTEVKNNKKLIQSTNDNITELQSDVESLKLSLREITKETKQVSEGFLDVYEWTITTFDTNYEQGGEFNSEIFPMRYFPIKAKARLTRQKYMTFFLQFINDDNTDFSLVNSSLPKLLFITENRNGFKEKAIIRTADVKFGQPIGYNRDIYYTYVIDNSLFMPGSHINKNVLKSKYKWSLNCYRKVPQQITANWCGN
ncbi:hypothetical protein CHUAL_011681 [Chamberlinius hualienensis]